MAETTTFTAPVIDAITELNHYVSASVRMGANRTYYWRVRCRQGSATGNWTATATFKISNFANYVVTINASDSVAAALAKFADAKAHQPATVRLAEDVSWSSTDDQLFNLVSYKNIWFDGNGKTITITNSTPGLFLLQLCTNLSLTDFTVDYNPLPYGLCEVTAIDSVQNRLTVKSIINADNPGLALDDPVMLDPSLLHHMRRLDKSQPGRLAYDTPTYFLDTRQSYLGFFDAGGIRYYTIQLQAPTYLTSSFSVGDYLLRVARGGSRNIVRAAQSTDISLDNITAYASPSQFSSSTDGTGFIVVNCRTPLKPGRYCSVTADCVYVRRNTIGPWVENCEFTANGDDCLNFHTFAAIISSKASNTSLVLNTDLNVSRFDVGDEVAIWDPFPSSNGPLYTTVTAKDAASPHHHFRGFGGDHRS